MGMYQFPEVALDAMISNLTIGRYLEDIDEVFQSFLWYVIKQIIV